MQWRGLYFLSVAWCCLHTASEPLGFPEQHGSQHGLQHGSHGARRRRSEARDSLALSREIFKNITKQLRDNIKREGVTDRNEHLLQSKAEESRQYSPQQGYREHHHEHHWGPSFEGAPYSRLAAHVGSEALLNCRVVMLKDKTVMWLKNTPESAQLLTVGRATHAGDSRLAVKFQYPNNWRLSVSPVRRSDGGSYMCQVSTHPPRTVFTNLTVLPPVLSINGDQSHDMKDRFYKAGSAIKLSCVISEEYISSLPTKPPVTTTTTTTTQPTTTTTELTTKMSTVFNRIDIMMNKSWSVETTTLTSTVSVSTSTRATDSTTEMSTTAPTAAPVLNNVYGIVWKKQGKDFTDNVTFQNMSSTISVSSASQNDSGTYTCILQNHSQVTINVHVLIGENQAAVHHDTWNKGNLFWQQRFLTIVSILAFILFYS